MFRCMVEFVPKLPTNETVFTDDGISDEAIVQFSPKSQHFICSYHVIYKCAKKCNYPYADRLRKSLWWKVVYGRSTESVRLFFVDLLAKHMPVVLKRSLEKWFCKIDKWGGPHIRRSFTGEFKGNTMGEVPFAAVLH